MDIQKKYVYVILSRTPSKFGWLIRTIERARFNHVSIAFDEKLESMYSFARIQNRAPIVGGLVREFPERFSLGKVDNVPVQIYRIEVCEEVYEAGKESIMCMIEDREYLYNLFSALTYPLFHGFPTFKAYTCAEFAANILLLMGIFSCGKKKLCAYTPEDIGDCLKGHLYYEGNLLAYSNAKSEEAEYFFEELGRVQIAVKSISVLLRLFYRKLKFFRQEF